MRTILILLLLIMGWMPKVSVAVEPTAQSGDGPQQTMNRQMVGLGLSGGTADGLAAAMVTARFTGDESQQIIAQLRLVDNDQAAMSAIVGKVHEGIAKQAAPSSIVRAVIRVRERHALANIAAQSLANKHQAELRPVITDALVSGLSQNELGQLTQGVQAREQGLGKERFFQLSLETMMTVRDMVRYGVRSTTATNVATKALSLGYEGDDMKILRQLINEQRMQANMESVSQRMLQGLNQGVRAGEMRGFAVGSKNGSASGKGGSNSGGGNGGGSGHGGSGGHGGGSGGGGGHGGGR
ncbi:MAG: hypothetical protein PHI97_06390 [Desulfobulbus sp.]|nr:hypothetical protein [Desulfobulbus sp.]